MDECCKECKWYSEEDNGLCTYYIKFKDENDPACMRYESEKR